MGKEDDVESLVAWATQRTRELYAGEIVAHRSCGIALAQTYGRRHEPYQALRRGGITGLGTCGAIRAGELILGEIFGDPDPGGRTTESLRDAVLAYHERLRKMAGYPEDLAHQTCRQLTDPQGDFHSAKRHHFCTDLAANVSRALAETILEFGGTIEPVALPE